MTRTYHRLVLTVLCALAGYITPVFTLRYPYHLEYFAGALVAAFLAWAFLVMVIALEPGVQTELQIILGVGAGIISWFQLPIVAAFQVIPLIIREERLHDTFDPVWIIGGLSPLVIPAVAGWVTRTTDKPLSQSLASALFRFSIPLGLLVLIPRWVGLPKQFTWLFLFTGIMFLVLDGLGTGGNWPLLTGRAGGRR